MYLRNFIQRENLTVGQALWCRGSVMGQHCKNLRGKLSHQITAVFYQNHAFISGQVGQSADKLSEAAFLGRSWTFFSSVECYELDIAFQGILLSPRKTGAEVSGNINGLVEFDISYILHRISFASHICSILQSYILGFAPHKVFSLISWVRFSLSPCHGRIGRFATAWVA